MKRNNIMRSVLMFVLIISLLVPTALQANALSWEGGSSAGDSEITPGNVGRYGVLSADTDSIIGYRFTGVNINGTKDVG